MQADAAERLEISIQGRGNRNQTRERVRPFLLPVVLVLLFLPLLFLPDVQGLKQCVHREHITDRALQRHHMALLSGLGPSIKVLNLVRSSHGLGRSISNAPCLVEEP
jgi:hypothetical protein